MKSKVHFPAMSIPKDLITHEEARKLLGISPKTMWMKAASLTMYQNPTDKRRKYYSRAEVLKLKNAWTVRKAA